LWCCTELFVYVDMLDEDPQRAAPTLTIFAETVVEREQLRDQWRSFDVIVCNCFLPAGRVRIAKVVDAVASFSAD
jgi:hypothetical protein